MEWALFSVMYIKAIRATKLDPTSGTVDLFPTGDNVRMKSAMVRQQVLEPTISCDANSTKVSEFGVCFIALVEQAVSFPVLNQGFVRLCFICLTFITYKSL